jgi:hypothetical protein
MQGLIFTENIPAILDGTKTQTRRAVKPPPGDRKFGGWITHSTDKKRRDGDALFYRGDSAVLGNDYLYARPAFEVGQRRYIKEKWRTLKKCDEWAPSTLLECHDPIQYSDRSLNWSITEHDSIEWGRWRSPLHMCEWMSRGVVEITGVRAERVQEISMNDIMSEMGWSGIFISDGNDPCGMFSNLWDSINGPGSWDANPWVWVVEFTLIK